MNQKGFTLVELLVMLVVLSILVGITVPNIAGIIKDNKKSAIMDDASRLVDNAKVRVSVDEKAYLPRGDNWECTILRLSALDRNDDFKEGPNDGVYDHNESFVLVKSTSSGSEIEYKYYVRLVEIKGEKKYGIDFADSVNVEKRDKKIFDNNVELNSIGDNNYVEDNFNDRYKAGDEVINCTGIKDVK